MPSFLVLQSFADDDRMIGMVLPSFSIVDLRERPEFASVVADRVWRAWWKPKGHELGPIQEFMLKCLEDDLIPSAVVALDGNIFMGSALLIASDLDGRPQYTPWVAAVWVDPAHRFKGVGSRLVRAGAEIAQSEEHQPVYLCAMSHNHAFYQRLGWIVIETDATEAGLSVFQSP